MLSRSKVFRNRLSKVTNIDLLDNDDSFKLYLKHKAIPGIDFAYELFKNYSIEIESANSCGCLMLVENGFNGKVMSKVLHAVENVSLCTDLLSSNIVLESIKKPKKMSYKMNPRDAFLSGFKDRKKNECSFEVNAPCPPGYVIDIPGSEKCY